MDKEILKRLKKHLELPKKYKKICDDCGLLEGNVGTPVPKWTYDFYQKQFNKKCGHVVVYGVRLWPEKDLTRKKENEMYTDNQILLGKKLLRLQKKGFCVNAAEKELIKLFIINRKRLKEEKMLSTILSTDLSTS